MKPATTLIVLVASSLLAGSALAAPLVVAPDGSSDYPTISAAIAAAQDGDTILLLDGTFTGPGNRDLVVQGRILTIRSQDGDPAQVTIDCEGTAGEPHRFLHVSGIGSIVAIEGLTVTGGHAGARIPGGGALLLDDSAFASVVRCVFLDNHADMEWDNAGGAAYVDYGCDPTFTDCEFRANSGYFGGAVAVNHYSHATFTGCWFVDNVAGRGGAIWGNSTTKVGCVLAGNTAEQGGAIWGNGYNPEESISCTYMGNDAPLGGAIYAQTGYGGPVVLQNTVIAFSSQGVGVHAAAGVPLQIACTDIFANADGDWVGPLAAFADVAGNFCADPCFCDLDHDEFTVCGDSTCLPAHSPTGCEDLVGALGAGCPDCDCGGVVTTERVTWGAMRQLFVR